MAGCQEQSLIRPRVFASRNHEDIHTKSIAFSRPSKHSIISNWDSREELGSPWKAGVTQIDGQQLSTGIPHYLMRPTPFGMRLIPWLNDINLVQFGKSSPKTHVPEMLRTALAICDPGILFEGRFDHQVG